MISLEDINPLFLDKGKLCMKVNGGATKKIKCGEKKKLPAERGGREDNNTKMPQK